MTEDRDPASVDRAAAETAPREGRRPSGALRAAMPGDEAMSRPAQAPRSGETPTRPARATVRSFLAGYDVEVRGSLERARAASSGLERVRVMHNEVRPSLVVHDALLESVLCPLLEQLPGGPAVAERLRGGSRDRAGLLARFAAVSDHVAAQNVYPVAGEEVEKILDDVEESFAAHARDETDRVSELLASAEGNADPVALASAMALQARRVPTRRPWASFRTRSPVFVALHRWRDRAEDWSDTHWNWSAARDGSPRQELVRAMKRQAGAAPPSVRAVLEGYDAAVDAIMAELRTATTPEAEARAAHRAAAAIAIHDAVVGGALCPLLEAVPAGKEAAARLRAGCLERAAIQQRWAAITRDVPPDDLYRSHREDAARVMEQLVERFGAHEREGTLEVESILVPLPDEAYRTRGSAFDDIMWPWHSEGPAILALRMALWSESAPTRAHPAMLRHPSSRILRSFFHLIDHFVDRWHDTWVERWFFPDLPRRLGPSDGAPRGRGSSSATRGVVPPR